MNSNRASITNNLIFILVVAGSTVGIGNVLRFPYLVAKHGGGTFLLVYLLMAGTFGYMLMYTDIAIGRKTRLTPIIAYASLNKKFSFLGYIASIVPLVIAPIYFVISAWVCKYFITFATGGGMVAAADGYFKSFITNTVEPLVWFFLFGTLVAIIICMGVKKGIENLNKISLPLLLIFLIFVTIYSLTTPGIWAGVKTYLVPDLSKLSPVLVLAALGQVLFSVSISMGTLVTFGSYMKKNENIISTTKKIIAIDTSVSFIVGLMVVPSIYTFTNGREDAVKAGAEMLFIALPRLFESMPLSNLVGALFFLMVAFTSLASSVALLETIIATLTDRFDISRARACAITFFIVGFIGILNVLGFSSLSRVRLWGMNMLDFSDFTMISILIPIVALLTCFFVGHIIGPKQVINEIELNAVFKYKTMYSIFIKYIAPVFLLGILILSMLEPLAISQI